MFGLAFAMYVDRLDLNQKSVDASSLSVSIGAGFKNVGFAHVRLRRPATEFFGFLNWALEYHTLILFFLKEPL